MGVHIDISYQDQAAVITLAGDTDVAGLEVWAKPLGEAGSAEVVVVDVDQARLVDQQALSYLLNVLDDPGRPWRLRLVARRSSLTGQLAAWKVHHRVAIHPNIKDALACRGPR